MIKNSKSYLVSIINKKHLYLYSSTISCDCDVLLLYITIFTCILYMGEQIIDRISVLFYQIADTIKCAAMALMQHAFCKVTSNLSN